MCAVIYDINGREASDAKPFLAAAPGIEQYIFCSSAGVYLKNDQMPHREEDATDPKCRHKVTGTLAQNCPTLFFLSYPFNLCVTPYARSKSFGQDFV